jgi:hypothetical protein
MWLKSFGKESSMKENMHKKDPIEIPITLRPLVGVVNKNGGGKSLGKLVRDQATHVCDCTKRPILVGWGTRYSNVIDTKERGPKKI